MAGQLSLAQSRGDNYETVGEKRAENKWHRIQRQSEVENKHIETKEPPREEVIINERLVLWSV